jgi:lipoyl(octanoyl) transferase
MALDEALLDSVAADPATAVVRTYEWAVPTLSLGYFQRIADAEAEARWASVPVVRRPTGGGALWHEFEVTYSVVIPAGHAAAMSSLAFYQTTHQAIARRLQSLGIMADRRGSPASSVDIQPRPFLCFTDRNSEDIVFRNVKLVGSAQRRRSGAILQHGSLLLGRSSNTPELPGLSDLAPISKTSTSWAEILRTILSESLTLPILMDQVRPEERARAETLRLEVYSNPVWTRRR